MTTHHELATKDAKPVKALEIRNAYKVFNTDIRKGKQTVLDDLTMVLFEGRCTGLLGHNGAGKTTSIRTILGLIRPDSGEVLYYGRPMHTEDRRNIGFMPEVNKLPMSLTAEEILKFQLSLQSPTGWTTAERKNAINAALEQVGLSNHRHKKIKHLSKGMARRIAWAQATIHKPRLLILDEPMSGLDPVGRRSMRGWIQEIRRSGITILLCTHELATIQTLCDDVYIVKKGKVVFSTHDINAASGPIAKIQKSDANWPRFALHLSGISASQITTFTKDNALSPPIRVEQDGFLVKLGFMEYDSAARWLNAASAAGLVVVRFGDASPMDEEELLKHFSQELDT